MFEQRTSTAEPLASMIGVPPWLPLLVTDRAPAVTPVSGRFSVICSSRMRATTLRFLPRTMDWACTQSSLSWLKS